MGRTEQNGYTGEENVIATGTVFACETAQHIIYTSMNRFARKRICVTQKA
jgi:hypothetical protein